MAVIDKDLGYKKILREIKKYKTLIIKAGIFGDRGTDASTVVEYAIANEYGTIDSGGNIPERSFIRSTADEKKEEWRNSLDKYLTYVVENKYDARTSLALTGIKAMNDIREKIGSNIAPENAPATKLKKAGSLTAITTTLIDSGIMRNLTYYTVENK